MNERETEYCKKVGKVIRTLREQKNKSVRLFAYENELSQATLSRIERGDGEAKLISLKKISESLGLSMSEFFEYIESDTSPNFKIFDDEHY